MLFSIQETCYDLYSCTISLIPFHVQVAFGDVILVTAVHFEMGEGKWSKI